MRTNWQDRIVSWTTAAVHVMMAPGIAVFLLAVISGCSRQESSAKVPSKAAGKIDSDPSVPVTVVRPTREHLKRLSTPQPAHVAPYEQTEIYAKVTGYLDTFGQVQTIDGKVRPLDIGDRVQKGQILARLWIPELEQERLQKAALLAQAQAEVAQAEASRLEAEAMLEAARAKLEETRAQIVRCEAELDYRKSEYERFAALVQKGAVGSELEEEKRSLYRAAQATCTAARAASATDQAGIQLAQAKLAKAQADVTSAQARLKVAQANLEQTLVMLNYATIKAPYDGLITHRFVDTGAFIQSAATGKPQPLFTIVRVDRLRIVANIPEAEAGLVQLGQPATFTYRSHVPTIHQLSGKVARMADALDAQTRTMRVEVELDAPVQPLRPGMFGSVTLQLVDIPDALMLPLGTVLDGNEPAVLVVENGKARRRKVDLGFTEGDRVQVISGLAGDELVILGGKTAVEDGQPIQLAP